MKDSEGSQKISSCDNPVCQPYSGQKLAFMPKTFDRVAQLLATYSWYSSFFLQGNEELGLMQFFWGIYGSLTFPRDKFPSIIRFKCTPDENENQIGYQMNPMAKRIMKSDDKRAYFARPQPIFAMGAINIYLLQNY